MQTYNYTYEEFNLSVRKATKYIASNHSENVAIVGLFRGGMPLAITLSHVLISTLSVVVFQTYGVECKSAPYFAINNILPSQKNIIVVDDILDSGHTLTEVNKFIAREYPEKVIHSYSIFGNDEGSKLLSNHHYEIEQNKRWIIFPWETIV